MVLKSQQTPTLSRKQGAVLSFLFEKIVLGDKVSTLDLGLKGNFSGRFLAAYANLPDSRTIVFTLPTYNSGVFFGVCATDPVKTATILANLEDYEREGGVVRIGEAIRLPDATSEYSVTHSILLLRTATLPETKKVPDHATIGEEQIRFALAVPLSAHEYEYRRSHGHDALMDKFERDGKDLSLS